MPKDLKYFKSIKEIKKDFKNLTDMCIDKLLIYWKVL